MVDLAPSTPPMTLERHGWAPGWIFGKETGEQVFEFGLYFKCIKLGGVTMPGSGNIYRQ